MVDSRVGGRGPGPLMRRLAAAGGGAMVLVVVLACVASVDGERSSSGTCPEGEVCSAATPMGLTFVGTAFYDDQERAIRLGPILAGGRFSLGMRTADGAPLPNFEALASDPEVLVSELAEGAFLDGEATYQPVQAHVTLHGLTAGHTRLRVVDPVTGELYDRLTLDVYELDRIDLVNLSDPNREHLLAGCEEMIGVRLVAKDGPTRFRAIDQDLTLHVDGEPMERERGLWDCFLHTPKEDQEETTVEIRTAGRTFHHTLAVRPLEDEGLETCPPLVALD
jgi:hypothetical protein